MERSESMLNDLNSKLDKINAELILCERDLNQISKVLADRFGMKEVSVKHIRKRLDEIKIKRQNFLKTRKRLISQIQDDLKDMGISVDGI